MRKNLTPGVLNDCEHQSTEYTLGTNHGYTTCEHPDNEEIYCSEEVCPLIKRRLI